jgi:DNA-binding NarL/FixJ family response regulator
MSDTATKAAQVVFADDDLWVAEGTVEKHVRSILTKLGLQETPDEHRRVLAVVKYLDAR